MESMIFLIECISTYRMHIDISNAHRMHSECTLSNVSNVSRSSDAKLRTDKAEKARTGTVAMAMATMVLKKQTLSRTVQNSEIFRMCRPRFGPRCPKVSKLLKWPAMKAAVSRCFSYIGACALGYLGHPRDTQNIWDSIGRNPCASWDSFDSRKHTGPDTTPTHSWSSQSAVCEWKKNVGPAGLLLSQKANNVDRLATDSETWSGESGAWLDSRHENRKRRPKAEDRWGDKSKRTASEAESRKPKAEVRKPSRQLGKQDPKTEERKPKAKKPKTILWPVPNPFLTRF